MNAFVDDRLSSYAANDSKPGMTGCTAGYVPLATPMAEKSDEKERVRSSMASDVLFRYEVSETKDKEPEANLMVRLDTLILSVMGWRMLPHAFLSGSTTGSPVTQYELGLSR